MPRKFNPNAKPIRGRFYYATHETHRAGDIVNKGPEDNDACLFITKELDQCITFDGFGRVYEVDAETCLHYFPSMFSSLWRDLLGGFQTRMYHFDDLPTTGSFCDELEIVSEISAETFFGPNGAQVAHVIAWLRSKEQDSDDDLFVSAFTEPLKVINNFYSDRLKNILWPVDSIDRYKPNWHFAKLATPTSRIWLKPGILSRSWQAAYHAARHAGRVSRCDYLRGVPPLVALMLRDRLLPDHFLALWNPMEQYFPIATLDSEIKGALYKF